MYYKKCSYHNNDRNRKNNEPVGNKARNYVRYERNACNGERVGKLRFDMVDVTTEALKMVKDSLSNFLTDVEGVASRADNRSSEIVNSCRTQVNQAKNDVSQSEARITALRNEISQAEKEKYHMISLICEI